MNRTYSYSRERSAKEKTTPFISKVVPFRKDETNYQAIIEGLLFVVGEEGVRKERLVQVVELPMAKIDALLLKIKEKYQNDEFGIELVDYGNVYKFISKTAVYPFAQKLFNIGKQQGLSQSALETLAIIAYKQPVTRVEIEELRGVGAEMMLRKLQARDLIREAGRSEAPGRPILYEVTEEFMDSFKLYTLNELPELSDYGADKNNSDLFDNE